MPQPVVSSRYLFLCSPPKIVFTFSPDSRPTFTKLMPTSAIWAVGSSFGGDAFCCGAPARNQRGRAMASTLSRESTSAEQLRDFRKTRREENKRSLPGPLGSCSNSPLLLIFRVLRLCKFCPAKCPFPRKGRNEFLSDSNSALSNDFSRFARHLLVGLDALWRTLRCPTSRPRSGIVARVIAHGSHLGVPSNRRKPRGIVRKRGRTI